MHLSRKVGGDGGYYSKSMREQREPGAMCPLILKVTGQAKKVIDEA